MRYQDVHPLLGRHHRWPTQQIVLPPATIISLRDRIMSVGRVVLQAGIASLLLAVPLLAATKPSDGASQPVAQDTTPLKDKHIGVLRERAAKYPRSEGDQAIVNGWPLYRTERGQTAFNDAMATLKATDVAAPPAQAFKGCIRLQCNISLPVLSPTGWLPAGRVWVSPTEYVLIAHSPRLRPGQNYRRHMSRDMRYFVFHEFHNSSRNTDLYDTISSHKSSVFVSFYMSKPTTDARGRRFVTVLQVAAHDAASIHASNRGSAGPGMEVARNVTDQVEPLQNLAGIVVATIVKAASPQLQVVNHRGTEGLPMLRAYEDRLAGLRAIAGSPAVTLPFVSAPIQRIAGATGRLDELIMLGGVSRPIPIASRGIVPLTEPRLIGPIQIVTRPVCDAEIPVMPCRQSPDALTEDTSKRAKSLTVRPVSTMTFAPPSGAAAADRSQALR